MQVTDLHDPVEIEALAWLVRVNEPTFEDWDGWEAWLAEDPSHHEVYWRLASDDADISGEMAPPQPRPVSKPAASPAGVAVPMHRPDRRRWVAVGIGMAAALVGAVWLGAPLLQTRSFETGAGEQRSVTLADGSLVHLDGGTRLTVDRGDPRSVTLVRGRALFEVTHDDTRPFAVAVAHARVTDLGTTFEVTRLERGLRVGVSEGIVRYDGDGQSETLQAGEGLIALEGVVTRRSVSVGAVSGWRAGRLNYSRETLAVIAEDLSRELGHPIVVDPEIAGHVFSGSVLTQEGEDLKSRMELLLGVRITVEGETWRLQARPAP
jgi:transmembrane sensor